MRVTKTAPSDDGLTVTRRRVYRVCGAIRRTVEIAGDLREIATLLAMGPAALAQDKQQRLEEMREARMESAGKRELVAK